MKEIKVGQVWKFRYGRKDAKNIILIQERLNSSCWRIYEELKDNSRMMTSDAIRKDYIILNKK